MGKSPAKKGKGERPRFPNSVVFSLYYDHLTGSGGFSPNTIKVYRNSLRRFEQWVGDRPVTDLSKIEIGQYLSRFAKKSSSTRQQAYVIVRGFYDWAVEFDLIAKNPVSKALRPKRVQHLIEPIPFSDVLKMMAACPDTPKGRRDRVLILFSYSQGLRESETARVELSDLRWPLVLVHGKGGKERWLPIPPSVQDELRRYLDEVRPHFAPTTDALFVTSYGRSLNPQRIGVLVFRAAERAGIQRVLYEANGRKHYRVTSHGLRRGIATALAEGGASLAEVQDFLGHASPATTRQYMQIALTQLAKRLAATHPLWIEPAPPAPRQIEDQQKEPPDESSGS